MRKAIILGAIIVSAYFSGFSQEPEDEVITAAEEFTQAVLESDDAATERILSPDYGDVSFGMPTTRTVLLRMLKEKPADVARPAGIELVLTVVRIYGNTAVLTTKANLKWKASLSEAKKLAFMWPVDDADSVTMVAIKQNGKWRIVSSHASVFSDKVQVAQN